jgi:hypothetical protein
MNPRPCGAFSGKPDRRLDHAAEAVHGSAREVGLGSGPGSPADDLKGDFFSGESWPTKLRGDPASLLPVSAGTGQFAPRRGSIAGGR